MTASVPGSMDAPRTIALAGNPNSGKTTMFNALTGERQHVGNYPGVTVEIKEGLARAGDADCRIVDLPGTYSLTAYSLEEQVARDYLLDTPPEAVIAVVDASNLERNLYLAVQLMELGLPLVIALNLYDQARARGMTIAHEKLSGLLGVPVLPTVASEGQGVREALEAAVALSRDAARRLDAARQAHYGHEVETHLAPLTDALGRLPDFAAQARWFALKLLEGDDTAVARLRARHPAVHAELAAKAATLRAHIERIAGTGISTVLSDGRYGFIAGACAEAVTRDRKAEISRSERVDRVVLSPGLGLPLFILLMFGVFQLTFAAGEPLTRGLETLVARLGESVAALWPPDSGSRLKSLLVDGILGGVGGVLVFLPNILLLFLAIAILEDSGYMARAAFVMDRLMHKIGLHGKSFIPMLIGFGCTVPAVLATRTLETRRDRLATMLILPLMSCGGRLPIYTLIIPAFFPERWRGPILWGIYVLGIALAILLARLLRATLFRGESVPFVMELPPYRAPTLRGLLVHMGERGWLFVRKAGTVILGFSILFWALSVWPQPRADERARQARERAALEARTDLGAEEKSARRAEADHAAAAATLEASAIGRIGRIIAPVLQPLGFDGRISTALLGAFAAKEMFVAQLGVVFAVGGDEGPTTPLREKLRAAYTPLQGFCILLFCLISMPCLSTVAVTLRESGSWKWAALQLGGLTALAWGITAAVYQLGRLALGG